MLAGSLIDLYSGNPESALRCVNEAWPRFKKSMMFSVQTVRVIALHLRARASIAVANAGINRDKNLRAAERDARRIERQRLPWANALARLVRAALQVSGNETAAAIAHLEVAIAVFETHDMALWEAVATRRKGELVGGTRVML